MIHRDEIRLSELHRNECWLALLEREDTREGTRGILGPAGAAQCWLLAFLFSVLLSSIVTIKKQGPEGRKEGREERKEGEGDRRKKRRKTERQAAASLARPCFCSAPHVQPAAQPDDWQGAFPLEARVLGPACLPACLWARHPYPLPWHTSAEWLRCSAKGLHSLILWGSVPCGRA